MLSQALRTYTRQHTSITRLRIHQHFDHTLTSTSEQHTPKPNLVSQRTAFLQTWDPLHDIVDAWALLRAVERKYGKVLEAHFFKDGQINTKYQMHTYVVFADEKSIEYIPKEGFAFLIPAPNIEERPGGPGLDDIRHLLDREDRDESFEFQPTTKPPGRLIGGRITHTAKDYFTFPEHEWTVPNKGLMREFLKWHGFHKLELIEESMNNKERRKDLFDKQDSEQVRMRAALRLCASISGLDNPAVIRELPGHENDGKESNSSPVSASMDSPESSSLGSSSLGSSSPTTLNIPISHESTSKSTQSSSLPTELPQPSSPTTLDIPISHESTSKSTQSSSLPTELPQPSSPTTLDIPISQESTSKSTQSSSLPTNLSQPPSQSPPEPTQLPPEPTPSEPTVPPSGQLTPEQKKTMQKQMSMAKQLMAKTKQPSAKKGRKSKQKLEEPKDQIPDKSPEEQQPSKSILASLWKFFGR